LPKEAGTVGAVFQSGGGSELLVRHGKSRGLRFSKVISYGNAADLGEAEIIEYFANDSETKIIGAYIEGVRDGQRFIRSLMQAAKSKPVAILKGGRTRAGARATQSHTGSLAGQQELWDTIIRQTGAVAVYCLEEMLDFIEACLHLKLPQGPRVGIIAWGGGPSVLTTDDCEGAGLTVPVFSSELKQKLNEFIAVAGSSVGNPVDSPALANPDLLSRVIRTVAGSGEEDLLLIRLPLAFAEPPFDLDTARRTLSAIIETRRSIGLPVAIVLPHCDAPQSSGVFFSLHQQCFEAGLPPFSTTSRAASAISRLIQTASRFCQP
jgi:acyl-CoA synthetase (NDP forming)